MELRLNSWRKYLHGFVVLPLLIAAIGILPIAVTMAIVRGTGDRSPAGYLQTIADKRGNARWRAAYQLSMLVTDGNGIEMEGSLAGHMVHVFNSESVKTDDPRVRQFLALAMGRTRSLEFYEPLVQALEESDDMAQKGVFVRALGYLGDERAIPRVAALLTHENAMMRHEAVQALGNIGSGSSVESLKGMLADPALDVRWDAAVSLAKLKDASGKDILFSLLDESYYAEFPHVSKDARDWAMEVAIRTSILLDDPELNAVIKELASSKNIKVKQAALSAIEAFSTSGAKGSA